MFGDVVSETCDDGSINSFGLSDGLQMVCCRRQMFDDRLSAKKNKELAYDLWSSICEKIARDVKRDNAVAGNEIRHVRLRCLGHEDSSS